MANRNPEVLDRHAPRSRDTMMLSNYATVWVDDLANGPLAIVHKNKLRFGGRDGSPEGLMLRKPCWRNLAK